MNIYATILAGGAGERFWPTSRQALPKQFLPLMGSQTMLQQTVNRLEGLVPPNNILIITSSQYKNLVIEQIRIPESNIILEPCSRNTAPAIALGAVTVMNRDPGAVMMVLPADHYIADEERFRKVLRAACACAMSGKWLVTLGVTPTRPETGYGYIHRGDLINHFAGIPAFKARAFIEKPAQDQAKEFLQRGSYLWNSGMFIWRADMINKMIGRYLPEVFHKLTSIIRKTGYEDYYSLLEGTYSHFPNISIDHAIMEQATNVLVMPGDFGWDDVGSWSAVARHSSTDDHGNVFNARGVVLDSDNCIVKAPDKKTVAMLGVKDLIIVYDNNCLLVCDRNQVQNIKKIIDALKDAGLNSVL